jgi:pimeloyl-ACP methyl ester carboxylesterase
MKAHRYVAVLLICLIWVCVARAGWRDDLDKLITTQSRLEQDKLTKSIVKASPNWWEVTSYIRSLKFPGVETGLALKYTTCIDGKRRPYVVYVPSTYSPSEPTPLMVILHGGVSSTALAEDPEGYAREHEFTKLAEKEGWLLLFPFGQYGATWWDQVGMANIHNLVRTVKREYNVDDDRVWMEGFSDGGSAAFLHAMLAPTDYAAFVALNGHMGVGSIGGDLPLYAPNFFNTPVYAVTTDRDRLYPSGMMRRSIEMAQRAGGKIFYREHEGGHRFSAYADRELPLIATFLDRHRRDPFPAEIIWETALPKFGLCRWFAIDEVGSGEPARWHTDHNVVLIDSTVIIGFVHDDSYEGKGVKVDRVVEQETLARRVGLQPGDVIVKGNTTDIGSIDDLDSFKTGLKRGDTVELVVEREGQRLKLRGTIPEPESYYVFKREKPSAMARVRASANRIDIETSRVGAFRILVHPDMFRLEQNLIIRVNGEVVYDKPVKPDIEFLLRNFLENRDRKLLYVAEVRIGPSAE